MNTDKQIALDSSMLNIKSSSSADYIPFIDTKTPVCLIDNASAGNKNIHWIDVKLISSDSFVPDIYKTTIKLEVNQK
jgi:hypothetical protein